MHLTIHYVAQQKGIHQEFPNEVLRYSGAPENFEGAMGYSRETAIFDMSDTEGNTSSKQLPISTLNPSRLLLIMSDLNL